VKIGVRARFLSAALLIAAAGASEAQNEIVEKRRAHIVSRVHQMTDGSLYRCQETPNAVEVEKEVRRFRRAYSELMALIDNSPHLDRAKRQSRESVDQNKIYFAKHSKEPTDCQDSLAMLRMHLDHPEGKNAVAHLIKEMRREE
jgi:hypothetical protein